MSTSKADNDIGISIVGTPTYELTNEVIKDGNILGRSYIINVTLYNAGNLRSEELKVNLSDEEGFTLVNYTYLEAGETKIVSFNWATTIIADQTIYISFYPADLDAIWTQYNTGSTSFTLKTSDENEEESTPGFELLLVLISILVCIFLWNKKR